jgi:hypothetical protein
MLISRQTIGANSLAAVLKASLQMCKRAAVSPVISLNQVLKSILTKSLRSGASALGRSVSTINSHGSVISNSLESLALLRSEGKKTISEISKSILTWNGIVFNSTLKKRRSKIKKHKLKKRRKGLRFNSKLSRQ